MIYRTPAAPPLRPAKRRQVQPPRAGAWPNRSEEPPPEEKKKPVKRSNSFSRRKNKGKAGEEPSVAEDGYSGSSDALQKPAFKLEEQKDPLRDALQQEAGEG